MLLADLLRTSLAQVVRNQRRYRGVSLNIALGVAGLITVMTMGDAIEKKVATNLELLGRATIIKANWDFDKKTRWHHGQFRPQDLEDLRKLSRASETTGFVQKCDQTLTFKQAKMQGQLMGVESGFFAALHMAFSEGREITEEEVSTRKNVCVIGTRIRDDLLNGLDKALDQAIWLEGKLFRVVGVLGGVEDTEHSRTLFVPITVAWGHFSAEPSINGIYVKAVNWHEVSRLSDDVFNTLARNHAGYVDGLEVTYYPEKLKTIRAIEFLVKFLLYGGLLLVVFLGGLGISNLMYLSVQERTGEIGLRKAVGATDKVILRQFLTEAVATGLAGTVAGIVLAVGVTALLRLLFDMIPDYEMAVLGVIGGVLLGTCLGAVSGLEPARRAKDLDPIQAVRFE
ncbi:MAG: ABC transporter permease [Desulfomonile tiedjei]|nr:ABC transporter permease [Desulfomonile tiedjei]